MNWHGTLNWAQVGSDLDGESSNDQSGTSISLSKDGSIIAIGSPQNDKNGSNSGSVRIFQNNNDSWQQIGSDIVGETTSEQSGSSIALSDDGKIIAIGAERKNTDSIGNKTGVVLSLIHI